MCVICRKVYTWTVCPQFTCFVSIYVIVSKKIHLLTYYVNDSDKNIEVMDKKLV